MFRRVVPLKLCRDATRFLRLKARVQAGRVVRVQVVSHEYDLLRLWIIFIDQAFEFLRKVKTRMPVGDAYAPLTRKWLDRQEQVRFALPLVL